MSIRCWLVLFALCLFSQGCALPRGETYREEDPKNREQDPVDYRKTGGVI